VGGAWGFAREEKNEGGKGEMSGRKNAERSLNKKPQKKRLLILSPEKHLPLGSQGRKNSNEPETKYGEMVKQKGRKPSNEAS